MTRQELEKMMGGKDKADIVIDIILSNLKKQFVITALEANAEAEEAKYKERKESGYYTEFSSFPEGFNLWQVGEDSELAKQWEMNNEREIEECRDRQMVTFARNLHCRAINHQGA